MQWLQRVVALLLLLLLHSRRGQAMNLASVNLCSSVKSPGTHLSEPFQSPLLLVWSLTCKSAK